MPVYLVIYAWMTNVTLLISFKRTCCRIKFSFRVYIIGKLNQYKVPLLSNFDQFEQTHCWERSLGNIAC